MKSKLKSFWWTIKLFFVRMYYGNPAAKLKIIGVTGTNGKTTTTTLLYKVATILGHKSGLIGTVEILINGDKYEPKGKVPPTTPDSVTLIKVFDRMVKAGCEYVFMEVSSHAIVQKRIAGISFEGGIFTNLTHDHLDYHQSFKNYFLAKKKFFDNLPVKSWALSNADDEHGKRILEDTQAQPFYYGFEYEREKIDPKDPRDRDYFADFVKQDAEGTMIRVNNRYTINSQLIGRFNGYNLLSVFAASSLLGFDLSKVIEILNNIEPPKGRFERFVSPDGVVGIVDYAHSPDAMQNVLNTINEVKGNGRLISVFGCGGDRDPLKRRVMGKIGAELSDIAIFTSDNPRSEEPRQIIEEMRTDLSMNLSEKVIVLPDRKEAIKTACGLAREGDIVAVLGKGHEVYQEVQGVKYPFDDMRELQQALEK
ncbi:MAG: UDP-N-acetylmuramoyl-L-alanyl-D-glutamate--2,6-diaminopimelate ligase [Candidatus Paceibacteria bacterium]